MRKTRKCENLKIRKMRKNTKARKFDNPKSVGMRKKAKTRKFEKTENTEKVKKGAENLISRSWGKNEKM